MENNKNPWTWWRIEIIFPLAYLAFIIIAGIVSSQYGKKWVYYSVTPLALIWLFLMAKKIRAFLKLVAYAELYSFGEWKRHYGNKKLKP